MANKSTNAIVKQIFSSYLEKRGHRKTPERFSILEEIYSIRGHFDVETLFLYMKDKNYRVSRATLYNTIELLLDCNLVKRHQFGKSVAQFEKSYMCGQHDHLIDTETGKVVEFCDPRIHEIIETACEMHGFNFSYHSLYIYGKFEDDVSSGQESDDQGS